MRSWFVLAVATLASVQAYGQPSVTVLEPDSRRMPDSDNFVRFLSRGPVDPAAAGALRNSLGLGTLATQNARAVEITGGSVTGLTGLGVTTATIGGPTRGMTISAKAVTDAMGAEGVVMDLPAGKQLILNPTGGSVKFSSLWNEESPGSYTPDNVLTGAPPKLGLSINGFVHGMFGGGQPHFNSISYYDFADGSHAGASPSALAISYTAGAGSKGGRSGINVASGVIGNQAPGSGGFMAAGEFRAAASATLGGVARAPSGQIDTFSTYGLAQFGATNLVNVSTEEANTSVDYGASSQWEVMKQFAGLNSDWGVVGYGIGTNGGIPGTGGRVYLWLNRQSPAVDMRSEDSIRISAGHNLPDYDYGILIGDAIHEYPFGENSKLLSFLPQLSPNANGHNAIPAAKIKPQQLGWGIDLLGIDVANQAFRSTGFAVQGSGAVTVGPTTIAPQAAGIKIMPSGQSITSTTLASSGANYVAGEYLYGPSGDIYAVDAVSPSGSILAYHPVAVGYSSSPPANPITLTGRGNGGAKLNAVWTQASLTEFSGAVKLSAVKVAALPACNSILANSMYAVTDAIAPIYNGPLTGGGSVHIPVFCNGSVWTAH